MSIQVDLKHLNGFVRNEEMEGIAPQVKTAHHMLHNGTGMGNDYIGWLALPTNYDKEEFIEIARDMKELGYTFVATEGTAKTLKDNGIDADIVNRVEEARPNILDAIRNKQVDIVINTPTKGNDSTRDGFKIRRTATEFSTEVMTSLDTLKALVEVKKKEIKDAGLEVYNIAE